MTWLASHAKGGDLRLSSDPAARPQRVSASAPQVYVETPLAQKLKRAMDHIASACMEHFAASSASKLLTKLDTLTVMAGGTVWQTR